MAKVCYFTGRKTRSANNRSHAMNATKRTVKPNLQKVRVLVDGKPKKVSQKAKFCLRLLYSFRLFFRSSERCELAFNFSMVLSICRTLSVLTLLFCR